MMALISVTMPAIMSFGYNQSMLGGVLTLDSFERQFPEIDLTDAAPEEKTYKSTIQGTVVALYAVGGLFGALSCMGLGDILGRKKVIMLASAIQIVGAILMTTAFEFTQLVVSRLVIGLGTGGVLATVPLWQSELSTTSNRGAHVVTIGPFAGLGATLVLFIDFGMSFAPESEGWRVPFALQILLSLTVIGFIAILPESPRWLVRQGRIVDAREILAALEDVDANDLKVEAKILEVESSLKLAGEASFKQVFHMGSQRIFHRAMLAATVMMCLQLTGVNCVTFYTNTIFETYLSLDSVKSRILAAIYQLITLIAGAVCVYTIEGFGRRGLMLASAAGNAVCLALVAALGSQPNNPRAMDGAVVFIFLFHFSYVIGYGGIPFLYAAELSPLKMRATINGISMGTYWIFCILITEITPYLFQSLEWRFFIIFAGLNVVMMGVVYFLFPETAGRTLEEIDRIFMTSDSIWDTVKAARQLPRSVPDRSRHGKETTLDHPA
ncbi:sugar transporter [Penicillium cinerascens]|uniref:Sugar transporter n=1 Tax=Penicillium cinerascens TaxID=70096 RepID=A0A9W9NGH0_9EURO|nr:sugar transporter [Penicillium cinerascens]KAJ5219431.1 sugar transporter [Penicillium cinerascens]